MQRPYQWSYAGKEVKNDLKIKGSSDEDLSNSRTYSPNQILELSGLHFFLAS